MAGYGFFFFFLKAHDENPTQHPVGLEIQHTSFRKDLECSHGQEAHINM